MNIFDLEINENINIPKKKAKTKGIWYANKTIGMSPEMRVDVENWISNAEKVLKVYENKEII